MNKRTLTIFIVFLLVGFTAGYLIGEVSIEESNTNEIKEPTVHELLERIDR